MEQVTNFFFKLRFFLSMFVIVTVSILTDLFDSFFLIKQQGTIRVRQILVICSLDLMNTKQK